ncbi:hypothetical protein WSM22_41590 [Cytophagales bacterium WSM2-2]|nr:hypothetical protein WSM22_41590 [Cytophagales bacterium WSM2-2]
MKIQINDHRKVFAVQEEFSQLFPNLKIEFYKKPSKVGEAAAKRLIKSSSTLGDSRVVHTKGELTLKGLMTISDLQQSLSDTYGLSAVVLRKSGKGWIETTENGRLSIDEQNEKTSLPA